ncbi:MAG TPA: hypothetical protein DEP10_09070 [Alphaproteobacteria bacterium]|nr:hypothetical protein [Alphaproteobacteria bacterium]|tara:strand:- start:329 stop:544 length:216 start_codon:yes stop_codon:yes gene_type:complete
MDGDNIVGSLLLGIIFLSISLAFYFLPTIVAVKRSVRNGGSVFILNLLLGWTLIAWVVALAMAFATVDRNA